MRDVELKVDGSNFIDQYQHMIGILISNDLLNVIRELLGDTPDNSMREEDDDEYRTHRYLFMTVQYTILHSMKSELRVCVNDINKYDVVDELKSTMSQIRVMEQEYMDGVSFNFDGRKHLPRKALEKCIGYMNTLCTTWTTE